MAFNYDAMAGIAARTIRQLGRPGAFRRGDAVRPCTVAIVTYTPSERSGGMFQWTDRRALVAAQGLDVPPDNEQDTLLTFKTPASAPTKATTYSAVSASVDEELKIVAPPGEINPAGVVVLWDLTVRK